jgi:type II secretory pathway pseudopilin PulG
LCNCRKEARVKKLFLSAQGLTILDTLITLSLIGVLIGVVVPRYQRIAHAAQEEALRTTLVNIRSSITLFKALNKRYPQSLRELTEKKYMLPARTGADPYSGSFFTQQYLIMNAVDTQGNILDAFGNPFAYDAVAGEVRSSTKEYEKW